MSPKILIEPGDLRRAAATYDDAATSLNDVRGRLLAVPPKMPDGVTARAAQVLEHSVRDLSEQLVYLAGEAAALRRRADAAERADGGAFNPLLDMLDPPGLGERFAMPPPPPPKKKGFWDKGIPGFFAGAGGNLKDTAVGAYDIVSMTWDSDERREMWEGLKYAWDDPEAAWDALWADMTAEKDRKAGNETKAGGSIVVEVAGFLVAPLKLTKLKAIKKTADAAESASSDAAKAADKAGDIAGAARRRLISGPRWRTGEVPWQPTGSAPGRWASRAEFHQKVSGPADVAASQARQRAADAQRAFVEAQQSFDRWNNALENAQNFGRVDNAAKLEKITDELNKQHGLTTPGSGP